MQTWIWQLEFWEKNIKKIFEDLEREDVIESTQPIVHFCSTIITGTEKKQKLSFSYRFLWSIQTNRESMRAVTLN